MSAFDNARNFFDACETALGWEGCKEYVADGATFTAQSEPLVDVHTVEAYCEWLAAFCNITAPGATYDLHTSSYDEATRSAIFFATFRCTHTGDGGPIPPTNKTTATQYVYVVTMNEDDKVERLTKIWNAPWAMKELGWM